MNKLKIVSIRKLSTIMLVFMISLFTFPISALADDYPSVEAVASKYGPGGSAGNTSWPSELTGFFHEDDDGGRAGGHVTIGGKTYYFYTNQSDAIKETASNMDEAITKDAGNQDERKEAVQKLTDVTDGMGLAADVKKASGILSGFTGVIATLLGILTVVISVGMTVFSAFDLCYIAFPVFRNKCEDAKQSGTGMMASKSKSANGETKLRFVSDDAQYAVEASTTEKSGQNPFGIYFKKRIVSYLILAILLFILLTGKITILTEIAIRLVDGILSLIQTV